MGGGPGPGLAAGWAGGARRGGWRRGAQACPVKMKPGSFLMSTHLDGQEGMLGSEAGEVALKEGEAFVHGGSEAPHGWRAAAPSPLPRNQKPQLCGLEHAPARRVFCVPCRRKADGYTSGERCSQRRAGRRRPVRLCTCSALPQRPARTLRHSCAAPESTATSLWQHLRRSRRGRLTRRQALDQKC